MKVIQVVGRQDKMSLAAQLASKLEPTLAEKDAVTPPPEWSRAKARIKTFREIDQFARVQMTKGEPAKALKGSVETHDGEKLRFYTDGSLRHAGGKIKGKANIKRLKRLRQRARRN